jgi:hypothetical protein
MCNYLSAAIIAIYNAADRGQENLEENDPTLRLLRNTDYLIKDIGAHVRYIDAARAERLPWSIIPAFQKLIKKLLPDVQTMLRPQWKYNYSVDLADLRLAYGEALSEYEDFVPGTNLGADVLGKISSPFHLISFPSLERKNILLHSLIGHEIGHLFAERYITKTKKDNFSEAVIADIQIIVDKEIDADISEDDLFHRALKENKKIQYLRLALKCWERGLEELLSDIVGAILFGPAAIYASLDLAVQQGLDFEPSSHNSFYPPWRMRIREILKILDAPDGDRFFPIRIDILKSQEKTIR